MGIGYNTQKKWVFGYGYWVSCGYHTQYPIPTKKVGTDVWFIIFALLIEKLVHVLAVILKKIKFN